MQPQWSAEMRRGLTPSQTVGPYLHIGFDWLNTTQLVSADTPGEHVLIEGQLLDAEGIAVPDGLIEIWQADAQGVYAHAEDGRSQTKGFQGFGRCATDADGFYRFVSIRPGAYPWRNHPNAWRPAHIHFSLFGNAFATRLVTQMYFPGDPLLALDPIYNSVPEGARDRMVSTFDLNLTEPEHALGLRFDIVLRGRDATPMEC